jgi:ribokinase
VEKGELGFKSRVSLVRSQPPLLKSWAAMAVRAPVCVVGSANIDLTFRIARLPRPGETLAGSAFHLGHGGKGANQAVAAARLGAHVTFVGRAGNDLFGQRISENLAAHGIDTTHLIVDADRPSGVASITVDDQAQNCIVVVPGANHGLSPQDIHRAAAAIRSARVLLCQLEVPLAAVHEACRIARDAGVRTILNPAPAAALPEELLRLIDLCVPNQTELEQLTGQPAKTLGQATEAACSLLGRGPSHVLVTLGERGALVVDDRSTQAYPAPRVTAVDTSGAGDAFVGALGVFLAEKLPLAEAVRQAQAVAALSVTQLGTQTALPTREQLERFLA